MGECDQPAQKRQRIAQRLPTRAWRVPLHTRTKNSFDNQYQQYSEECSFYSFSGDLGATLNTFWKGLYIPCGDTNLFSGCVTLLLKERLESHLSHRGRLAAVIKNVAMSA